MSIRIDIVIVNWNAGGQLKACLESIARASRARHDLGAVVVVDNDSSDDSLEGLEGLGIPLKIRRNTSNRGFAAACNQGAAMGNSDFILFLNPDTELERDTLDLCATAINNAGSDQIGLWGAQLRDENGHVARTCARRPSVMNFVWPMTGLDRLSSRVFRGPVRTEWDHASSARVHHVMGAFFLTRRAIFESLRGFDERFFVYIEDLDYATRMNDAGFSARYLAEIPVFHRGCGTSETVRARRLFYALDSRVRYAYRHFGRPQAFLHSVLTFALELPVRVARAIVTRRDLRETLVAYRLLRAELRSRPPSR